jgi:hypothetical protein
MCSGLTVDDIPDLTSPATRAEATHTLVHVINTQLTTAAIALAARVVSNSVSASRSPNVLHHAPTSYWTTKEHPRWPILSHGRRERRRVTGEELATDIAALRPSRVVGHRLASNLLAREIVCEPNLRSLRSHAS